MGDRFQHYSSNDATFYFRLCDYHSAQSVSFLPCFCSNTNCSVKHDVSKAKPGILRGQMPKDKWVELFLEHRSKDVAFCCPDCREQCRMCTWPWQTCTNTRVSRSYCKDHFFQKLANSTNSIECKGNSTAARPAHTILKQSVTQNEWTRFVRDEVLLGSVGSIAGSKFTCQACVLATVTPTPGEYVDKSSVVDDVKFESLLIRESIATGQLGPNDDDAWAYGATDGELASNNPQPFPTPTLIQTTMKNNMDIEQSKSRKNKRVITTDMLTAPTDVITTSQKRITTSQKRAKTHATSTRNTPTRTRNTRSNTRAQAHVPTVLSPEEEHLCEEVLVTAELKLETQAASLIQTQPTDPNYKLHESEPTAVSVAPVEAPDPLIPTTADLF